MPRISNWERVRDLLSIVLTPLGTPGMRRRIVARAMAFPLDPIIEAFRRQSGLPEKEVQALARELRRYLAICAISSHQWVPMEGPVDSLWRLFIAHEDAYDAFCDRVAATRIWRDDERKERSRERRLADARRFARLYGRVFGEPPPEAYWPGIALLNRYGRVGHINDPVVWQKPPSSRGYVDHSEAGNSG